MKLETFGALEARVVGADEGPVVVLLHGFGAPGDDLVPLARALPAGARYVFPVAPLDLGPSYLGGRAWWPIDFEERMLRRMRGDHGEADVPPGLEAARSMVIALLEQVRERLAPTKLVLGGFSQGAMLSLDVALHSACELAGLVLLSTTQLAEAEWAARYPARRGLPVFMSHGKQDELLPFAVSEKLRDRMRAAGLAVEWTEFVGGHGIPPQVLQGMSAFVARVLA